MLKRAGFSVLKHSDCKPRILNVRYPAGDVERSDIVELLLELPIDPVHLPGCPMDLGIDLPRVCSVVLFHLPLPFDGVYGHKPP